MKFCFLFTSILLVSNSFISQNKIELKIDSILNVYKSLNKPGLSIGIIKNEKIVYNKSFGLSNLEYDILNSDSSIFSLASIAKQFTSACIWSLIKEKRLSLEDDIRKYLPELPEYSHVIKIKHMLNHTSGLRNYHALMNLSGFNETEEYYNNQFVLDLMCKQKGLNNIPGEKVVYGNTSYTLLAIIIERITKKNLQEYAKENIFSKLSMKQTIFRVENNSIIKNRSVGYQINEDSSYSQFPRTQCSYGAGSLGSSIKDLYKWVSIFNSSNSTFNELANFLTTQDTVRSGKLSNYARGVMIDEYKGYKTIHHSGYAIGSQSQIISLPILNLSIIILTNSDEINPTPISYNIIDLFIENTNKLPLYTKPYKLAKNDMLLCSGQYKELYSDMRMDIIYEDGILKSKGSQGKNYTELISYEKGKFFRKNNESVKYEFPKDFKDYDLIIYFGGTPFYFNRAKFIEVESTILNDYEGDFYSSELEITYHISVENNKLFLSYRNNPMIPLVSGQKDEFGNGARTLYSFERNSQNEIVKFTLASEGTVNSIHFFKVNK